MRLYNQDEIQELHTATFITGYSSPESVLPPGISQDEFATILEYLKRVVGQENVVQGKELLNLKDHFTPSGKYTPSAAVW